VIEFLVDILLGSVYEGFVALLWKVTHAKDLKGTSAEKRNEERGAGLPDD
jgi:hypothetical protein